MKRLTIILLAAFFTSCSVDDTMEDLRQEQQQDAVAVENYQAAIIGTWIDNEQEENARFESEQVYFMTASDTLGGFDYWIEGDQLTVKYGTYTEITKQISISGDVLSFGDKTYTRQ
ncbi:hypothetical protein B620_gp34 [Croceibacter phage P2559S]|uniref:hypothetical protein n=1 Tax=Croceibacter phage P2559S TaxID=1176422 RepID=UPI0002688EBD|nr:hypothetical protein B620_gp34 [Croceibacter phage P2559S]AFM54812.1 hypothetical protein P2559S_34 [Croceibacter phage P2559S]